MSKPEYAVLAQRHGLKLIPVTSGHKTPAVSGWTERTYTLAEIGIGNAAIETTGLLVLDIDNKNGKDGNASLLDLQLEHGPLPPTLEQTTPTGGRHLVYRAPFDVANSGGKLGAGLDTRGWHGYVLAAGSVVSSGRYELVDRAIADAPAWLVGLLGRRAEKVERAERLVSVAAASIGEEMFIERLKNHAPIPRERHLDDPLFVLAAVGHDLGIGADRLAGILEAYLPAEPPLDAAEAEELAHNVCAYSKDPVGVFAIPFSAVESAPARGPLGATGHAAPGRDEEPSVGMPSMAVGALRHAWPFVQIGTGGLFIDRGHSSTMLTPVALGQFLSANGGNPADATLFAKTPMYWDAYPRGFTFAPERPAPAGQFNTWTGFSVAPKAGAHKALDRWLEHIHDGACDGDFGLAAWLLDWLANLVQTPWRKPGVAIVFSGRKGVGKNLAIEPIVQLVDRHALVVSSPRYLTSNFNAHFQQNLLTVLDEAFWSGNKDAEGSLKTLITGTHHTIERKGFDPFKVPNLSRVVVIGNETWLVPATGDERRFAVFDFSRRHQQDRTYFEPIGEHLVQGNDGLPALLAWLKARTIVTDSNKAPDTPGLLRQKLSSMSYVASWWHETLSLGRIAMQVEWGKRADALFLYDAFRIACRARNMRYPPTLHHFIEECSSFCSGFDEKCLTHVDLPDIVAARSEFDRFIGAKLKWKAND